MWSVFTERHVSVSVSAAANTDRCIRRTLTPIFQWTHSVAEISVSVVSVPVKNWVSFQWTVYWNCTSLITGETYDHYGIGEDPGFPQYRYATICINIMKNNIVRHELIGVFWVELNGTSLELRLRNLNAYQVILIRFLTFKNKTKYSKCLLSLYYREFMFIRCFHPQLIWAVMSWLYSMKYRMCNVSSTTFLKHKKNISAIRLDGI